MKRFHSSIVNDHISLAAEKKNFKDLPHVRKVENGMIQRNYFQIKKDIEDVFNSEIEKMLNHPELKALIISRKKWYRCQSYDIKIDRQKEKLNY